MVAALVVALVAAGLLPTASFAAGHVDFAPHQGESPIVRWSQQILRGDDPGPWLEISDEGSVLFHVPAYLRGAGEYQLQLDADELGELRRLAALLENLDIEALRALKTARLRELDRQGAVPTQVGAVWSRLELRTSDGQLEIFDWQGLGFDAKELALPELQSLADLEKQLSAWLDDPRRRRVEVAP